ncbi:MAG: methyltransferase domain-containing protein [archaeon]|nr:methyltransferase domain-containing protein [archaeon]
MGKQPPKRTIVQTKMEAAIVRPYKEGKPVTGHKSFNWVQRADNKQWVHAYNSPEFIRDTLGTPLVQNLRTTGQSKKIVVDFCGGEGLVTDVLQQFLKSQGINATVINSDLSERNLGRHRKQNPEGVVVRADSAKAPYAPNSLDAATVRYGIHYFSKKAQSQLMKEIYKAVKPGGVVIVYHPHHQSTFVPHVKAMAAAAGMSYAERRTQNYFPTEEEFARMTSKVGFEVSDPQVVAEHWYSPESYADRWGGDNKEKRREIQKKVKRIFDKAASQKKYAEEFKRQGKRILKPGHHIMFILRKPE